MVELSLDGVAKRYGSTTALSDVSIAVAEGEFFTLVGPSGCGKTTTLRLVAGFETPTAGSVRFDGRSMAGVPPEDRDIGVVFQNYALFPHLSVGENVAYGLNFSDPPDGVSRDERVTELLALVDLPGLADRDPGTLSGGQRQRVALARALAPGPDLLLLDEPMSALDAALRERLRMQVREIQSELGVTTLYVTHDQEEALAVSDRLAVMHDGRVEQVGTPREVYRRPASRFVADFLGDNNVLTGRVIESHISTSGDEMEGSRVAIGEATFRLPVTATPGERVTFCVRPERLRVGEDEASDENCLAARVVETEFLGDVTRVYCEWAGGRLVVRTSDPDAEAASGTVTLRFDPADVHVIDVGGTETNR